MPLENSGATSEWLRLAERDLARVSRCLEAEDPELAAFCLQQAVEKSLKAFLLSKGWVLRRIHDLEALLDDAIQYDADLEKFRAICRRITAFYTIERYPLPVRAGISSTDVRESLEAAKELVDRLRRSTR